ncbi:hypothetical protein DF213_03020 [Dickeya dianthicola]|uniref:Uncharacterized protein n=1 Tax=Dickeya dianthicola TaxID=204039 RepID=A0AAX1CAZ0_9GAMM|nr:hypothetical protein DF213_03020 [Dickeya dianthicola]
MASRLQQRTSAIMRYAVQRRYLQVYSQVPCLRPFIKLALMETDLPESSETRDICSLVADYHVGKFDKV